MLQNDENSSGNCDCGDKDSWKEEGTCKNHKPKKLDLDFIMSQFDDNFKKNFVESLKKSFYLCFCTYEIAQYANEEHIMPLLYRTAEIFLNSILKFL